MSESQLTTHTVDTPGARLYYEQRGTGPLLLLIGSPMDSTGFTALADALADRYTVVTYDPRGIGNSRADDTDQDVTPELQAGDVHRLVAALGGGPVDIFGSSGGAVVGLALVTAHPDQVGTLVAHEPPVIELLPDRAERRAEIQDIYDTYRTAGPGQAMQKFMAHTGLGGSPAGPPAAGPPAGGPPAAGPPAGGPQWQPSPEQIARMRATTGHFLAHLLRPTTDYQPDIAALRAAPARIVVGAGATSAGQLANRTAVALAAELGSPAVEFPGDHGGFAALPEQFSQLLDQVLSQPT